MARFYLFELPESIKEGLEPFKIDFPVEEEQEEHTSSESESGSSGSESESEDSQPIKPAKQSNFSSGVTKYIDEEDEMSMEQWQWANRAHITGTPYVYFTNKASIPDGKVLSIYKSWFTETQLLETPVESVCDLPPGGKSCVLMVASGDFAGAIFEHRRHHHRTDISNPFGNLLVVQSKTFHRYTTRRKQGGAQSASDSARGKANSAGSTIRRANERAFQNEIMELLISWAPQLRDCHRIFLRAPGRSNRQLITGFPNTPIEHSDPRLSQVPFATGKPTLNACKSAWIQLTQAQIVDAPVPPTPRATSPAPTTTTQKQQPPKQKSQSPQPVVVSEAEQASAQIADSIKRSKLPALKAVIESKAGGNWDFQLEPHSKFFAYPTPLLYAAHFDKHNVVLQLLKWGANPLVRNEHGQVIGDIASSHKKTSEALQIARKELGENKWDWKQAKVGHPQTKEQLLERDLQEKLRIQEENARLAAEQEKQEKEQRMERLIKKHGSGKLVGGLYEASRGLSEADLQQVERERRARAAEARLAKSAGNRS